MSVFSGFLGKDKKLKTPMPVPVSVDIHSHLIPGIDDGCQTLEESLSLISEMIKMGFRKIITTPHIMGDYFQNDSTIIRQGLIMLQQEMVKHNLTIDIEAASEYYVDDHFLSLIEKNDLLWFGDKYVLIETNTINFNEYVRKAIFELGLAGYKPILAHPERYTYMWNNFNRYFELKDMGVYFQINLVSLSGFYNQRVKETAEKLIDENLVDFIGTDAHEIRYLEAFRQALSSRKMLKLSEMNLLNDSL